MFQPIYDLLENLILGMGAFVVVLIVFKVLLELNKKKKTHGNVKSNTITSDEINDSDVQVESLSLELMRKIEWKNFENLCCEFFVARGLDARATCIGADGGVDIELYKRDTNELAMIVQCKAYKKNVGVKDIREFYGVLAASKAKSGIFITTSDFTPDAKTFAKGKSPELQLSSGVRFISLIKKLPSHIQDKLLKVATYGDYTTPTCSSCDIKMTLRRGRNGNFYGCRNYPRCRSTINIAS